MLAAFDGPILVMLLGYIAEVDANANPQHSLLMFHGAHMTGLSMIARGGPSSNCSTVG
jgi:hypothetical protein